MGKQFTVFVSTPNKNTKSNNKENVPPPNSPVTLRPLLQNKTRAPLTELSSTKDDSEQKKTSFVMMDVCI